MPPSRTMLIVTNAAVSWRKLKKMRTENGQWCPGYSPWVNDTCGATKKLTSGMKYLLACAGTRFLSSSGVIHSPLECFCLIINCNDVNKSSSQQSRHHHCKAICLKNHRGQGAHPCSLLTLLWLQSTATSATIPERRLSSGKARVIDF